MRIYANPGAKRFQMASFWVPNVARARDNTGGKQASKQASKQAIACLPGAAPHSIAVEFIVWNPRGHLIHTYLVRCERTDASFHPDATHIGSATQWYRPVTTTRNTGHVSCALVATLRRVPYMNLLFLCSAYSKRCAKLFTGGATSGARRSIPWRSRSGRRPGRVRWGRPLLSRPRGAFGSGAADVEPAADSVVRLRGRGRAAVDEPAADSVVARSCAGVLAGMDGCEVRLCLPCARVRPCVPCPAVSNPVRVFYRRSY